MTAPIVPNIPPPPIDLSSSEEKSVAIASPVPVKFASLDAGIRKPDPERKDTSSVREILATPARKKEAATRRVCGRCNREICECQSPCETGKCRGCGAVLPRLREAITVYELCSECSARDRDRERRTTLIHSVPATCRKCGREVLASLPPDAEPFVEHCRECTPPKPQPTEGETFPPKALYRVSGKRVMNARPGGPRKFGTHDYVQWAQRNGARNDELAEIYKSQPLERAQQLLRETSARKLQREHPELGAYETVRKAKIRVLRFTADGDVVAPSRSPEQRAKDNQPKRKCPHGQRMHREDQHNKSRHCSICYPHGRRGDTPQLGKAA